MLLRQRRWRIIMGGLPIMQTQKPKGIAVWLSSIFFACACEMGIEKDERLHGKEMNPCQTLICHIYSSFSSFQISKGRRGTNLYTVCSFLMGKNRNWAHPQSSCGQQLGAMTCLSVEGGKKGSFIFSHHPCLHEKWYHVQCVH